MSKQVKQGNRGWVFSNLNETFNNKPFFRKVTRGEGREHAVARILKRWPHPNIVKIYRITPEFIDMEIVSSKSPTTREILENLDELKSAKAHMHRHGIAYIDWKPDNIGKGKDGKLKVFDFDASGIFRGKNWNTNIGRPWAANHVTRNNGLKTPIETDNLMFKKYLEPNIFSKLKFNLHRRLHFASASASRTGSLTH
jgi:hypothetical protein